MKENHQTPIKKKGKSNPNKFVEETAINFIVVLLLYVKKVVKILQRFRTRIENSKLHKLNHRINLSSYLLFETKKIEA